MYTLKKCKKDMISMWGWLAKTGGTKNDYVVFLKENRSEQTYKRFKKMIFQCPCCTYAGWNETHTHARCDRCPVTWRNNMYEDEPICVRPFNEYSNWDRTYDGESRMKYALEILELAKKIKEE